MLFGAHVSISGGIQNAPLYAHAIDCECFQFFSRSPRGGQALELTASIIKEFKNNCQKYNLADYYIHTPYYINLASVNNKIYYGSISAIRLDLERGSLLGAKYVMTHLGSAKDTGNFSSAIKLVVSGLEKVLDNYQGTTKLLFEISAGAGQIIGDSFEELAKIINSLEKIDDSNKPGVCFDTAHAFASGYDLRNKKSIDQTLKKFDRILGLKNLKLIHINDSQTEFNSRKDRHANIGQGMIGIGGINGLVQHLKLQKINMILETPCESGNEKAIESDLEILKKMRELSNQN